MKVFQVCVNKLLNKSTPVVSASVLAFCFFIYRITLAPTITWGNEGVDGGDLITAACTLGVPHPTGYPTYVLLARLFTWLPWGDMAFRVNLLSALSAAGAVAFLYLTAVFLLHEEQGRGVEVHLAAVISSLSFGFSPVFWSQALIAEVYALNAFFVIWLIYLFLKLTRSGIEKKFLTIIIFAFSFGLALGNHISIALVPVAFCFPWILRLKRRQYNKLSFKKIALVSSAFALGAAVYLYLPLRAAQRPPVNWGVPCTWSRFWWVVSGKLYHRFMFSLPLVYLPGRIYTWLWLTLRQFTWWGWVMALPGMWRMYRYNKRISFGFLIFFTLTSVYSIGYNTTDSYVYLIPAFIVFAIWMSYGACFLLKKVSNLLDTFLEGWGWKVALWGGVLLLPFVSLGLNLPLVDLSDDYTAHEYGFTALRTASPGAIIISVSDAQTFALWYFRYAERIREDVAVVSATLFQYDWYLENLHYLHPNLVFPSDGSGGLEDFIALNLPSHTIYLTDPAVIRGNKYLIESIEPLYLIKKLKEESE